MKIPLKVGIKVGEVQHLEAEVKPLSVSDIIEANLESERVEQMLERNAGGQFTGYKSEYVKSPTLVAINTLRRQVSIGPFNAPLELTTLNLLEPVDFEILQTAVENLDQADKNAMEALSARGRPDGDSEPD